MSSPFVTKSVGMHDFLPTDLGTIGDYRQTTILLFPASLYYTRISLYAGVLPLCLFPTLLHRTFWPILRNTLDAERVESYTIPTQVLCTPAPFLRQFQELTREILACCTTRCNWSEQPLPSSYPLSSSCVHAHLSLR